MKNSKLFSLETAHLILFFVYHIWGFFIPGIDVGLSNAILSILVFLMILRLCLPSDKPRLRKYAVPLGIAAGVAAFVSLNDLLPLLPSWPYGLVDTIPFLLLALTCIRMNALKLIRVNALYLLLSFFVLNVAALGGLKEPVAYLERGVVRSALGMSHPNYLYLAALTLVACLYLGRVIKPLWLNLLLTFGVYLLSSRYTHSRTGVLFSIVLGAFQIIEWLRQKNRILSRLPASSLKLADLLAVAAFPLNCIFWFGLIAAWPHQYGFVVKINSWMSGRISLAYDAIAKYGISAFGNAALYGKWLWTDIGYSLLLLNSGVVSVLVIGLLWTLISLRFYRNKQRRLLYTFAFLALWGGERNALLENPPNIVFLLALADLSSLRPAEEEPSGRPVSPVVIGYGLASAAVCILLAPRLFSAMRTLVMLRSGLLDMPVEWLHCRTLFSFCLVFAAVFCVVFVWKQYRVGKTISRKHLAVAAVCAVVILFDLYAGNRTLRSPSQDVLEQIEADAPALETILASKSGDLYADPYPELYIARFPGIKRSVLYQKDLSRIKNATVLCDVMLDGGDTFLTQGFQYAEISDAHAVYTSDASVIAALQASGITVTPYYSHPVHVDLEEAAWRSMLTYEPGFSGIFIDQLPEGAHAVDHLWTNYNTLYGGTYRVTFTCRLLWPEENPQDTCFVVSANYVQGGELGQADVTLGDADETGLIKKTIDFGVGHAKNGQLVSFSVYGGNVRRLIVEDITYVKTG